MRKYTVTHMVRMEHLNHHESLYAGQAAEWLMEASFVAINLEYGNPKGILYKNTHSFEFSKPVFAGDIITYEAVIVRLGKTSVTIHVRVFNEITGEDHAEGFTTFVTINPNSMRPVAHGMKLDETDDMGELDARKLAEEFFK